MRAEVAEIGPGITDVEDAEVGPSVLEDGSPEAKGTRREEDGGDGGGGWGSRRVNEARPVLGWDGGPTGACTAPGAPPCFHYWVVRRRR